MQRFPQYEQGKEEDREVWDLKLSIGDAEVKRRAGVLRLQSAGSQAQGAIYTTNTAAGLLQG